MKISIIEDAKIIISNPDSKHCYFAWPTVARLKNGRIAVAASGYRTAHVDPFGKAVMSVSEDGGKTYSRPAPIIDTPLDDRDSGIVPFGESGLVLTSFGLSPEYLRDWYSRYSPSYTQVDKNYVLSYLDNITDGDVEKYLGATYRISYDNGVTFGPIMKSPVTTPHGPTLLPSGNMIWVGCLHSAEVNNDPETEHERIRAYTLSTEDGRMEEIGRIVFEKNSGLLPCEVHTLALDDNRLIAHIRSDSKFNIYQSESSDGGKTWSAPHALNEENGGAPSFLFRHSSGAIIALYGYRELPYGIKAMFSFDEGKSWDVGHTVYESPITDDIGWDIGYPSCIELDDGSLLTVFYSHTGPNTPAVIMQNRLKFEP